MKQDDLKPKAREQPKEPMYYLCFIGVDPDFQNVGIGSIRVQGNLKVRIVSGLNLDLGDIFKDFK